MQTYLYHHTDTTTLYSNFVLFCKYKYGHTQDRAFPLKGIYSKHIIAEVYQELFKNIFS